MAEFLFTFRRFSFLLFNSHILSILPDRYRNNSAQSTLSGAINYPSLRFEFFHTVYKCCQSTDRSNGIFSFSCNVYGCLKDEVRLTCRLPAAFLIEDHSRIP